jgi:hypothetical protein
MSTSSTDHGRRVSEGAYASMTAEQRQQRARGAAMARHHPEVRQQQKADKAARYIADLVDGWPPLTDAQRGRLAALLTGAGDGSLDDGGT